MSGTKSKEPASFPAIGVVGGGAWGTALANLCAGNGVKTLLWAREPEVVDAIAATRENKVYLPGIALAEGIAATGDLSLLRDVDAILLVTPAQHSRAILSELCHFIPEQTPIAICSKGIETTSGLLMTEVLSEVCSRAPAAVLSGPSFARDVASGLPTAVTLACADAALGARWMSSVGAPHFRPYLSDDLVGAALGGAVKNVLAIAAGVVVGRGFGESARAALVARGFAEFQRLGMALGAKAQTLAGLSGLGDLILTASSSQSRNMSLGIALGEGQSLADIMSARNSVAEGVATAPAILALAKTSGVDAPICSAVAALLSGAKTLDAIINELLSRPFTTEAK
jgi:glycerol-3-phosphate dehydrogenase (NAD(P)+)